jgi:hypothetical protein
MRTINNDSNTEQYKKQHLTYQPSNKLPVELKTFDATAQNRYVYAI